MIPYRNKSASSLLDNLVRNPFPGLPTVGRRKKFDAIARIACIVTGRERAAIILSTASQEILIGVHGAFPADFQLNQLPASHQTTRIMDLPDATVQLPTMDSVNGTTSHTAGLTVIGIEVDSVRIGALVVADSHIVGPLSPATLDQLIRLSDLAGRLIDDCVSSLTLVRTMAASIRPLVSSAGTSSKSPDGLATVD